MSNTAVVAQAEPLYPENRAFVVQIERGATDRPVGRIEHVGSGRARRFESGEQLLDFLADVLDEFAKPGGDRITNR